MDNKKIDDMFFKIYGQDKLAEEYKDMARNSNAYYGFKAYIKLEELISIAFNNIEKLIRKIKH